MKPLLRILILAIFACAHAPGISADDAKEGRGIASTPSSTGKNRLSCNSNVQTGDKNSNASPNDSTHSQNGCGQIHRYPHSFFMSRTKANTGSSNTGANPVGAGR